MLIAISLYILKLGILMFPGALLLLTKVFFCVLHYEFYFFFYFGGKQHDNFDRDVIESIDYSG